MCYELHNNLTCLFCYLCGAVLMKDLIFHSKRKSRFEKWNHPAEKHTQILCTLFWSFRWNYCVYSDLKTHKLKGFFPWEKHRESRVEQRNKFPEFGNLFDVDSNGFEANISAHVYMPTCLALACAKQIEYMQSFKLMQGHHNIQYSHEDTCGLI